MIIINLSCSGYMIEIYGEQVSVVGLNTKIQSGKKTTRLNYTQHKHFLVSSNRNVQWFKIMMEKLKTKNQKNIQMRNWRTKKQHAACIQCFCTLRYRMLPISTC